MRVVLNFNFGGQCEEAIHLYQRAFGMEVKDIVRYSDAVDRSLVPSDPAMQNRIYHAEAVIGSSRVMMSDNSDIPYQPGTANFQTVSCDTDEEVRRAYDVLMDGGHAIYPLCERTYSSCFCSVVDRFGIRWTVMTER